MPKRLELENVSVIFKNFAGRASNFNDEGDRNFSVLIRDQEVAQQLMEQGWNIKELRSTDEFEEVAYHLSVKVNYDSYYPPRIFIVKEGGELTALDEASVSYLDYARIQSADVQINPYSWSVSGKVGVKAYLSAMWVHIDATTLEKKYMGDGYL